MADLDKLFARLQDADARQDAAELARIAYALYADLGTALHRVDQLQAGLHDLAALRTV
ncbi:MAG TPA: hypothetical protein VF933_21175 [Streptosporangiaceae bacterium]